MKIKLKRRKYGKWKNWRRRSFRFYFVFICTLVVTITVLVSSVANEIILEFGRIDTSKLNIIIMVGIGITVGFLLSFVVSRVLLNPIRRLQSAMNDVSEGNLDIKVEEKNIIDEIENINHSFNIMIKELQANNEIQKNFITNVSHEFKTPLSVIEGYLTLLQDPTISEDEKNDYINELLETTNTMNALITNILVLSKIENQSIQTNKEDFFIDEKIRKIVVLLEPLWSKKEIELSADLEQVLYNGNETIFMNVWKNLIENAIKFSPNKGKITIELITKDDDIIFTISDEGCGIKEEEKKLIFNRFYQGDSSRKQEGNGLGLTLVKKCLEINNGTIDVENLEKGCKFTVKIPK